MKTSSELFVILGLSHGHPDRRNGVKRLDGATELPCRQQLLSFILLSASTFDWSLKNAAY